MILESPRVRVHEIEVIFDSDFEALFLLAMNKILAEVIHRIYISASGHRQYSGGPTSGA